MSPVQWLDILADVGAILASVAVLVTTTFVWRQMRLQAQGQDTDERRFLRESINVIHDTLQADQFRKARQGFFNGPHKEDYAALESREKGWARYILSIYALLDRMARHGAVDEAILRDYWQSSLVRDWDRLENFVSGERLKAGNGTLYKETERLIARWKEHND